MMRLHIDRRRTRYERSDADLAEARRHYADRHWIKVPQLLAPELLAEIQKGVAAARFVERWHMTVDPPSADLCMEASATAALLELVTNDRAFLDAIAEITGCESIVRFTGDVYRLAAGMGHQHGWHDDLSGNRVAAMSINLSDAPYTGGHLQMRHAYTKEALDEVENTGPGDAIVFRLAPELEHRSVEVTSGAKTAFAGWFRTVSPLIDRVRAMANPGEASASNAAS